MVAGFGGLVAGVGECARLAAVSTSVSSGDGVCGVGVSVVAERGRGSTGTLFNAARNASPS
jgi:hypothetical protein